MPTSRAVSLHLLHVSVFFFISLFVVQRFAYAAESKDSSKAVVSQPGTSASAMDRVNAHANANPNDIQALFMRAVMLAEQNRREDAIKAFTEISEKYPDLPEPYNNLAVLYADQGQYDKARTALENAIKTHPSYATAHENLGDIYAKMASEAYDKALQLDSGNVRTQGKLSLIKKIFVTSSKPSTNSKTAETVKPAAPPAVAAIAPPVASTPTPASSTATVAPPAVVSKPDNSATVSKPAENKAASESKAAAETKASSMEGNSTDKRELEAAVMQWAKAWSSKDMNRYLGSYANSFQVPDGLSRKAWEQSRRQRIDKPTPINVDLSNLKIKQETNNRAQVSFRQNYRSGGLAQSTNKILTMVRVNSKWQIEQERADR